MKDSKLFAALTTLSVREFNRFVKFLQSPYINENKALISFGEYLVDLYADFEHNEISKEEIHKRVFGGAYNDLKVRHLLSDMLKLLEKFFAMENYLADPDDLELDKLAQFRKRYMEKHFSSVIRRLRGRFESDHFEESQEGYYKKFLLEKEVNLYTYFGDKKLRRGENNIVATSEALDNYFILQKLRYGCIQANYGSMYNKTLELFLLEEIMGHVAKRDTAEYALISAYYLAFLMLSNKDVEDHFINFKNGLKEHNENFELSANRELYNFAQNYCIGRINRGDKRFFEELFELYKQTLSNGVAFAKGELSAPGFKNMVTVGCNLKQYDWVRGFIADYLQYLPSEHQENSRILMTALLYWHLDKYSETIKLLSRVEYDDPFYALDSRSLLMKIYFELGEFEVLRSLCDSFKIYLRRNKMISATHIGNYTNLINYTLKLIKVKPDQHERLDKVKNEISTAKGVYNRAWLLEQIERMETSYMEPED